MATQLFEYAIIREAKKAKNGDVVEKASLIKRGECLAKDISQANLIAGREIPEADLEDLERITLAVRPF